MRRINKVLIWQFGITLAMGGIIYVGFGTEPANAAWFGGFGAVVLSLLLRIMVKVLDKQLAHKKEVKKEMLMLFFIPRLVLVVALFAYGIGILKLGPIPMVLTFAMVYLVYWMDWKFSSEGDT